MEEVLKHGELFDVIDFHFNYDYQGGYGIVSWIRQRMKSYGYERPIWAGDAGAAPMIDRIFTRDLSPEQADDFFEALRSPSHARHEETVRWYERKQAEALVKKAVVCMDAGVAGVNFGNLVDAPGYWGGRNWTFQGLFRQDGTRRPAFFAYQLVAEKTRASKSVERLPSDDGVFVYRFETDKAPVLIAWAEAPDPRYRLRTRAPFVLTTPVSVERSELPSSQRREIEGDGIALTLTTAPIIIEGAAP
jgi:hypothetical protein